MGLTDGSMYIMPLTFSLCYHIYDTVRSVVICCVKLCTCIIVTIVPTSVYCIDDITDRGT